MKNSTSIQAVYSGSENYTSSQITASNVFSISKGKSKITLDKTKITAKVGDTITLRAKVVDSSGDRINNSKVVFKLNGKTITDKDGNALSAKVVDGEAVLDYTVPTAYPAKSYNITAIFGGDYYERCETSG